MTGGEQGGEFGAKHQLNDVFVEILIAFNEEERAFRYTIDESSGPVATGVVQRYLVDSVKVFSVTATGATVVLWNRTNF